MAAAGDMAKLEFVAFCIEHRHIHAGGAGYGLPLPCLCKTGTGKEQILVAGRERAI